MGINIITVIPSFQVRSFSSEAQQVNDLPETAEWCAAREPSYSLYLRLVAFLTVNKLSLQGASRVEEGSLCQLEVTGRGLSLSELSVHMLLKRLLLCVSRGYSWCGAPLLCCHHQMWTALSPSLWPSGCRAEYQLLAPAHRARTTFTRKWCPS